MLANILKKSSLSAVTSAITLMETLVLPYRLGNILLAKQYEAFLTRSRGVRLAELTTNTCKIAAQLRAVHGIKTPDAFQLATALITKCSTFVTNDRVLPQIDGIRVIQIADYLQAS
jgi:predicted nucleic acid-binding protein